MLKIENNGPRRIWAADKTGGFSRSSHGGGLDLSGEQLAANQHSTVTALELVTVRRNLIESVESRLENEAS